MLSSIYFFTLYNIFLCSTSLCFCVQKDFYNDHVYIDAFFFFFFRNISISFTNIFLLFDFFSSEKFWYLLQAFFQKLLFVLRIKTSWHVYIASKKMLDRFIYMLLKITQNYWKLLKSSQLTFFKFALLKRHYQNCFSKQDFILHYYLLVSSKSLLYALIFWRIMHNRRRFLFSL